MRDDQYFRHRVRHSGHGSSMPAAGLVQWLELMPSPDWMCRSELMLPPLRALQANPAFELRPVTLPDGSRRLLILKKLPDKW